MAKRLFSPDVSSDTSDTDLDVKRPRVERGLFSGISVYIIQVKLEPPELDQLYFLATSNGADVQSSTERADVIITRISMRKRLERHIAWELAKRKAVVTPAWITESVAKKERLPCKQYVAVPALEDATAEQCPDHVDDSPQPPSPKNLSYMARYAVQRASPLTCPNQALLVQLAVIHDARAHDGDERSATSYARSMAAIKAYPLLIKSAEQVSHLPFLGPKLLKMVHEFTTMGYISETKRLRTSARYRSLAEFNRIHGIGPYIARKLYDEGCRTLDDLDRRYGAERERTETSGLIQEGEWAGIRTMLELRDELSVTIPREEAVEIAQVVSQELEGLESGCMHTICGGYRRGKPQCNDVDIVFTHPQKGKERRLCERLVKGLVEKKIITHVLHHSSFRSSNPIHAPVGASRPDHPHWDTLDKALVILKLPEEQGCRRLHRRVDLICAPIDLYWTAVVGWTGSTMFERDLRLWAKQRKGLKFDSAGITRRRDTRLITATSERAVFEIMGLEWVDPTLRNADL